MKTFFVAALFLAAFSSWGMNDEQNLFACWDYKEQQILEALERNPSLAATIHPKGRYSLLHIVARRGYFQVVNTILNNHELDINLKNELGDTPLMLSCHNGHIEVVKQLLYKDCLINLSNKKGRTALLNACYLNNPALVQLLLEFRADTSLKDSDGKTALHEACGAGYVKSVALLLNHSPQLLEAIDGKKRTPLITTCNNMFESHFKGYVKGVLETATLLLEEKNADIGARDEGGDTPAHYAAYFGNPQMLSLLIKYKANVNLQDDKGRTPLHCACERYEELGCITQTILEQNSLKNCSQEVVRMLLQHDDINIELKDENGMTAMDYAAKKNDGIIIKMLREASTFR